MRVPPVPRAFQRPFGGAGGGSTSEAVVSTRHPAVFTPSRIEVDVVVDLVLGDEFATRAAVAALTTARAITLGSLTAAVLASLVTSGVAHADAAKAAKLLRESQKLEAKDPKAAQAKLQQALAESSNDPKIIAELNVGPQPNTNGMIPSGSRTCEQDYHGIRGISVAKLRVAPRVLLASITYSESSELRRDTPHRSVWSRHLPAARRGPLRRRGRPRACPRSAGSVRRADWV
jgi:hypothetical protein